MTTRTPIVVVALAARLPGQAAAARVPAMREVDQRADTATTEPATHIAAEDRREHHRSTSNSWPGSQRRIGASSNEFARTFCYSSWTWYRHAGQDSPSRPRRCTSRARRPRTSERIVSRLIIVSNRLPVAISMDGERRTIKQSSGGLATGLRAVMHGENALWIGWFGDSSGAATRSADVQRELLRMHAKAVSLSTHEIEVFYEQISNAVLWPLCHDRIDQLPLRIDGWDTHEAVNQRFADVAETWAPGDTIWVHDYHLLRVPQLLRERLPDACIGFFLHVPFPNPEIFFTLSVRRRLVEGMLGADLIGFHARYRGYFTAAMRRLFGIHEGLSLPGLDRRTRMRRLRENVFGHDVHALAREFRAALEAARPTHHASMHA